MEPIPNDDGFPHNERRYMCETGCFGGAVHCLTAANRFVVLNAIILVLLIPCCFADGGVVVGVYMLFEAISLLLLFLGLRNRNRSLLWLHMMLSVFTLSVTAIALMVVFVTACSGHTIFASYIKDQMNRVAGKPRYGYPWDERYEELRPLIQMISAFASVFMAFCFLLHCWCLNVVNRCDTYLRDYKEHLKKTLLAARNVCNHPGCQETVRRVPSKAPPPYTLPL